MIINFIKIKDIWFKLQLRNKILAGGFIILMLALLLAVLRTMSHSTPVTTTEHVLPVVRLLSISNLNNSDTTLSLTGTLRSKSEADLRFEIPGRITRAYAKVGKWVSAGSIIAEVENSAQRAQVTQALGALQAAKAQAKSAEAQMSKVNAGTREEQIRVLQAALAGAENANTTAKQTAKNALLSAYATVNQSILHGTDTLFRRASKYNPKLDFTISDSDLRNTISAERVDIRYILDRQKEATLTDPEEIITEIVTTTKELQKIKRFYDKVLTAIDKAVIADAVAAHHAAIVGPARASILGQISALTAANDALVRSENAINISKANLDQGVTGAQPEDVDAAKAQVGAANASVTSALGTYQAALSMLEKTRVRAPISGTLSSFSARRGDFVGTQALGRIVGTGGIEVVFNIPSTDKSRIKVGDKLIISSTIKGTVTSISNSTDSFSQQLEVRADLASKTNAANGSVVNIQLLARKTAAKENAEILVPINSIKFNADETVMFAAKDTDNQEVKELVAVPITLGGVRGSVVVITDIEPDILVVTDARGLSAGQMVTIK